MTASRTYLRHLFTAGGLVFAAGLMAFSAAAAPGGYTTAPKVASPFATEWDETPYSRARLVWGGPALFGDGLVAGVEIELKDGWKTYWRVPGEAGVPPVFDFSGSDNLRHADVRFPAPKRFKDKYGEAIGYKHKVVFPVRLSADAAGGKVALKLRFDYAVCRELCLPVGIDFMLPLDPDVKLSSPHRAEIAAFDARVPPPPQAAGGLKVAAAELVTEAGKSHLNVTLADTGEGKTDIFVEGPEALYFSRPRALKQSGGDNSWSIPVSGLESPDGLKGKTLTFTVTSGDKRLQQNWVMD